MENKFSIAIGRYNNKGIINIIRYNGCKDEIISFINVYYERCKLRCNNEKVVFNINYSNDNDLYNLQNWHTFDSLIKRGVFKI